MFTNLTSNLKQNESNFFNVSNDFWNIESTSISKEDDTWKLDDSSIIDTTVSQSSNNKFLFNNFTDHDAFKIDDSTKNDLLWDNKNLRFKKANYWDKEKFQNCILNNAFSQTHPSRWGEIHIFLCQTG